MIKKLIFKFKRRSSREREMKIEIKIKPYHLYFSFVLLLMVFLDFSSAKKSNLMISWGCNVAIAECLANGRVEELLMELETIRRFITSNQPKISYSAQQSPLVCNTTLYANRIVSINKYTQPCTTFNRCNRSS